MNDTPPASPRRPVGHYPHGHRRADASDERGASAVEYGLLITGIALVVLSGVLFFGGTVENLFGDTCESVAAQAGSGTCS